jgi:hypothetical protein
LSAFEAPPGPLETLIHEAGLSPDREVSKYEQVLGRAPDRFYKTFPNYKQDNYVDYDVVDFCRKHPTSKDWMDYQKFIDKELELAYGHVVFNQESWNKGVKKYFPERPRLNETVETTLDAALLWVDRVFSPFMRDSRIRF